MGKHLSLNIWVVSSWTLVWAATHSVVTWGINHSTSTMVWLLKRPHTPWNRCIPVLGHQILVHICSTLLVKVRSCYIHPVMVFTQNSQICCLLTINILKFENVLKLQGTRIFALKHRIRPNYRTVRLEFFKITGKTCGNICIHLYFKKPAKDLSNNAYAMFCLSFSVFLYKSICCCYAFELHRQVDAIQMGTHNMCLYKEFEDYGIAWLCAYRGMCGNLLEYGNTSLR